MMSALLKFSKEHSEFPVIDFLNQSTFDELITVDLPSDQYKYVFNVDQKYWTLSLEGTFSTFYQYVASRVIHPDDRDLFREKLEPVTLLTRLAASDGLFNFEFRVPTHDGGWRWCEQYVVSGR